MQTLRILVAATLLLLAAPALAGDVRITIGHGRVEPSEVIVSEGDTVTWLNVDQMPGGHSIVADDDSFRSPGLGKDESWSHTFTELGRFPFHIAEHPDAKGIVIVE